MSDIKELQNAIVSFREERDWKQFHNPKDLAICLSVEASELLETFLWKSSDEANQDHIKDELADVLNIALLLAHELEVDVKEIVMDKLARNAAKYPVDKAKGSNRKYTEL